MDSKPNASVTGQTNGKSSSEFYLIVAQMAVTIVVYALERFLGWTVSNEIKQMMLALFAAIAAYAIGRSYYKASLAAANAELAKNTEKSPPKEPEA